MTVIYYGYILSYEKSFSLKHIFSIWKRCRCMCVSPDKCVNRMEKKESLWSLCYTLDKYTHTYTPRIDRVRTHDRRGINASTSLRHSHSSIKRVFPCVWHVKKTSKWSLAHETIVTVTNRVARDLCIDRSTNTMESVRRFEKLNSNACFVSRYTCNVTMRRMCWNPLRDKYTGLRFDDRGRKRDYGWL